MGKTVNVSINLKVMRGDLKYSTNKKIVSADYLLSARKTTRIGIWTTGSLQVAVAV